MDSAAQRSEEQGLAQPAVAGDLKAAVGARRELGDELEDPVLEAFLARVEGRITQQVQQQLGQSPSSKPAARASDLKEFALGSMGIAVPLMVAAGIWGGLPGIVVVAVAIVLINLGFFYAAGR